MPPIALVLTFAFVAQATTLQPAAPQPAPAATPAATPTSDRERTFLEAWALVRDEFYDAKLHGVDWESVRAELAAKARAATTDAELSAVINSALDRLHASHTRHYHPAQREYYEVLDIFHLAAPAVADRPGRPAEGQAPYTGIGVATRTINGRVFAYDVYDGGPAAVAGLLPGDELLGVDDGPWGDVEPFRGRAGARVKLRIRRDANGPERTLPVRPERFLPSDRFRTSIHDSARLLKERGHVVGYIRVRSYSRPEYHEALKAELAGPMQRAGALVLDLRGGWGGAQPTYLDIFNPLVPRVEARLRDGTPSSFPSTWTKPVVMITDEGTRSGKEILAYGFKKHRVGPIVGQRTAGAVLGGRPYALHDHSILLLAVSDVRVDGERLEGVGVQPDVPVARNLEYAAGRDPQIDAAIGEAVKRIEAARPAPR